MSLRPACIRGGARNHVALLKFSSVPAQEEALQAVSSILGCSRAVARTLLMHFRWNSDTLFGAQPGRSRPHYVPPGSHLVMWHDGVSTEAP